MKVLVPFFNLKTQSQPCESTQDSSRWLLALLSLRSLCTAALSRMSLQRIVRASLAAVTGLRVATSNYRLYVGVWLIAVVGPLSSVSYQLFDRTVFEATEYYGNAYYYLFAISPHVSLLISLTGVFFLFPQFSRAKFFLVVPSSYHLAKIIHLWQVTSNAEYHEVLPREFFLLGLTLTIVWFFTADYLMGLQFHKQDGIMARIEGILNSPGIDDRTKVEIARGQVNDLKALKSQS